jgi:glycosyltransferase involved in cell wall biosynthesis
MNGGGVLIKKKDFFRIAALVDALVKDKDLRRSVVQGQLKASEKFSRENVGRILLRHVEEVAGP